VVVFEKEDSAGGLLRYGIPDFKLNKKVIDRRLEVLQQEGLVIKTGIEVGKHMQMAELVSEYDAVCLCIGAEKPRDLAVEGRNLEGIHFAMEYLKQQNRINSGKGIPYDYLINAKDKQVVVIGGGDTGSDCVGTAIRQGAAKVTQVEILPKPPEVSGKINPHWPGKPGVLKTTTSHEEGCDRRWEISTVRFLGEQRAVTGMEICQVSWGKNEQGSYVMTELPGTREILKADLVLLAMGFLYPVVDKLVPGFDLHLDKRGNIKTDTGNRTSHPKIFAAGDARSGASLVVHAIYSGRQAAVNIHQFLQEQE